jgi:hypothetical protein
MTKGSVIAVSQSPEHSEGEAWQSQDPAKIASSRQIGTRKDKERVISAKKLQMTKGSVIASEANAERGNLSCDRPTEIASSSR